MRKPKNLTVRHAVLTLTAVTALSMPLLAIAGSTAKDSATDGLLKMKREGAGEMAPETLYARLKDQSRDLCGSRNVRMTGDIRRSAENAQCYEGTLTAAVERLDHPGVT
ncbi:MAG: hypothetical protein KJN94_10955, partial [Gammaproteobacteria bacterium]|nr:hypothetical protein [Gammaproteobacteria bacterium]